MVKARCRKQEQRGEAEESGGPVCLTVRPTVHIIKIKNLRNSVQFARFGLDGPDGQFYTWNNEPDLNSPVSNLRNW